MAIVKNIWKVRFYEFRQIGLKLHFIANGYAHLLYDTRQNNELSHKI